MKKLTTLMFVLLLGFSYTMAQVPSAFSYQAVVRNNSGEVIADRNVSFRISILQNSESGAVVYTETHAAQTNSFGLVTLKIGKGTPVTGTFAPGGWGAAPHFLKVETDPAGGSAYTHMGTSQLLAVPYAFHAQTVENDKVNDDDADPDNELQQLSISGTRLTLSDGGGTVTLPSSGGGDNWGTQTVVTDATLSGNGTTASPLKVVGDLSDNQTLSLSGSDLSISGGNTVSLPSGSNPWTVNGDNLSYTAGNVFIGTSDATNVRFFSSSPDKYAIAAKTNSSTFAAILASNSGSGPAATFMNKLKIQDGTQGNGKVLTSDANGNSSWQTPATGAWKYNNDNIYYDLGKVGIGTSSPSFDLEIVNKSSNAEAMLTSTSANSNLAINRANQGFFARIDYRNADGSGTFTTGLYRNSPNFRINASLTSAS